MARASASELREDIERRRAEVVKRLNEIARARAEIAALEEALRARVRDDELDRLERVLRSPTSSDEFAEVMTMGDSGGERRRRGRGRGRGRGRERGGRGDGGTRRRRRRRRRSGAPIEAEQDLETVHREGEGFIAEKMWEQRCLGHWKHLWGAGWEEAEKAAGRDA